MMLPTDKARILAENLNILSGACDSLDSILPGWLPFFEKFLHRVWMINRNHGKGYEIRGIKVHGLAIAFEWNVDEPLVAPLQKVVRRFKSDVVHHCGICGRPANFKAPIAGFSYCRDCMQLHMCAQGF